MNEEIQKEILKILTESHSFVLAQAPDAIQQIVGAAVLDCFIGIFFLGIFGLFFIGFATIGIREIAARRSDGGWEAATVIFSILAVLCVMGVACNTSTLLQAKYYPKAFLIEKLLRK